MPHHNHDRTTPPPATGNSSSGVSRRNFMQTLGISAAAGALTQSGEAARAAVDEGPMILGPGAAQLRLRLNGESVMVNVEPSMTLLDVLRRQLDMTGSKEICDRGACGGCSVIVDGTLVNACMMLAFDADGSEITTIEGLANGDELHPLQEAFIRHDGLQCGYCTPGFIVAGKALLDENPKPTLAEIQKGLGGNICRCAAYNNIFNAVLEASGQKPLRDTEG